jgi:hypothetical protein
MSARIRSINRNAELAVNTPTKGFPNGKSFDQDYDHDIEMGGGREDAAPVSPMVKPASNSSPVTKPVFVEEPYKEKSGDKPAIASPVVISEPPPALGVYVETESLDDGSSRSRYYPIYSPLRSSNDNNDFMLGCSIIGCLLAWVPIVGCITFCLNLDAPGGSPRRFFSTLALMISLFVLFFNIFYWPIF